MADKKERLHPSIYIIKTDNIFTAICESLGTFGQGETQEDALKKFRESTACYIAYILEKYPNDWKEHIFRHIPPELLEEEVVVKSFVLQKLEDIWGKGADLWSSDEDFEEFLDAFNEKEIGNGRGNVECHIEFFDVQPSSDVFSGSIVREVE